MRLHAPTKATTLGVGGALVASMLYFIGSGRSNVHELLITLFLFVTAPVPALMLAKAALHLRLPSRAPVPGTGAEKKRGLFPASRSRLGGHFFAAAAVAAGFVASGKK